MVHAIRLRERGVVDTEQAITHRFPLTQIAEAVEVMGGAERNKVVIQP
jgi:threonine dehydrogenase-like Zn-dependent dehydrogenase